MRTANKILRRSDSLPASVAAQVRTMAKRPRLSANRMLVELIENGIEAEEQKQREFFELAERFRAATNAEEVKRLGDQTGTHGFRRLMPRGSRVGRICLRVSAST